MTNAQKRECRYLAENTNMSAKEISEDIGCSLSTAQKRIKWFRKTKGI